MVDIAANSGANAVKFQAFTAANLVTKTAKKAKYQRETDDDEIKYDMIQKLELT
jgi:sialic acid synthase SpsE